MAWEQTFRPINVFNKRDYAYAHRDSHYLNTNFIFVSNKSFKYFVPYAVQVGFEGFVDTENTS